MSAPMHTRGPWAEFDDYEVFVDGESNVGNSLSGWWVIGNPELGNGEVAALLQFHGTSDDEAEANARLIAAAPCLLEALEGLLAKVECGTALDCDLCDAARAAIAKARGAA